QSVSACGIVAKRSSLWTVLPQKRTASGECPLRGLCGQESNEVNWRTFWNASHHVAFSWPIRGLPASAVCRNAVFVDCCRFAPRASERIGTQTSGSAHSHVPRRQWMDAAHFRTGHQRSRIRVRNRDVHASAESSRARIDERNLGTDLRNL